MQKTWSPFKIASSHCRTHLRRRASRAIAERVTAAESVDILTSDDEDTSPHAVLATEAELRDGTLSSALMPNPEGSSMCKASSRGSEESRKSSWGGSLKGMVLLNLGALLFGSNQVVIKVVEETLSPTSLNALRFCCASLCFLPYLSGAFKVPQMRWPALELGCWLTAGYTAQAFGLAQTSANHGAFTGTFTVLVVPLLCGAFGRKIANRTWFAACAALAGVSLLTTSGGDPNWGDLWCVLSAVLFGVHKWRSESVTSAFASRTTELVSAQLFVLAAASMCLAAPELLASLTESGVAGTVSSAASLPWLEILFMGVGTTALTLWIEMDALKEVSAPLAALIYTAEPLWGASFAWVLLDERWGAQGWVGAAMILAASLFSQLGGDPAEKATGSYEDSKSKLGGSKV